MRELEVAQLMAEGNSNKQIARRLARSIKTVESHRAAAMRKAGVRSAAEFVRFAIKQNLIQA
jgi:DNA-binding NarL/FixJ family response regulator